MKTAKQPLVCEIVENRYYKVRSDSNPTVRYNVYVSPQLNTQCNCLGAQYTGHCKHQEAVLDWIAPRKELKAA